MNLKWFNNINKFLLCGIALVLLSGCAQIQSVKSTLFPQKSAEMTAETMDVDLTTETAANSNKSITPPAVTGTAGADLTIAPTGNGQTTPESTITPGIQNITIWIPPQFDPSQKNEAAQSLNKLFTDFMTNNPNIKITLRIKSTSGDGSALNTMTAAKNAAPDVIPTLVMLNKEDLEAAVQKGLVYPITTTLFSEAESWYSYASQASVINNTVYGIPVAGDALVLAYRPSKTGAAMTDWPDILSRGLRIAFVPSSSDALFPTFIYKSMGGKISNDQGQPWLDQTVLTDTLNFFLEGAQSGVFPPSLSQIPDQTQSWQLFTEGTVYMIVSRFSSYKHYLTTDMAAIAMPGFDKTPDYPMTDVWSLAVSSSNPQVQEIAVKIAEMMAEPVFNDIWTHEAGYLPVRVSDHKTWENDPNLEIVNEICPRASLIPNETILDAITPVLNEAVTNVIKSSAAPDAAAEAAISKIKQ